MNPLIDLAVKLIESAVEVTIKIIEASAEHTAEQKAGMIASLKLRLDAAAVKVAAVKFRTDV